MKENKPRHHIKLVALHKHWTIADGINYHLRRSLNAPPETIDVLPPTMQQLGSLFSTMAVLGVWYSLLYVVIEGYLELSLEDKSIDELLKNTEYVSSLRRFRNATFHYQDDPLSGKILGFLDVPESEKWVNQLNTAFKIFFERELGIEGWIAGLQSEQPA